MELRYSIFLMFLMILPVSGGLTQDSFDERANRLIAKLESGKIVFGILGGAMAAPRIAKVLGTSDLDFILADLEHEVRDYRELRHFVLGINDFNERFREKVSEAPSVLVKLGNRAGWDARYEVAEVLKIAPTMGVCIPFVESRADLEKVISAVRNAETSALAGMNVPKEVRQPWPLDPKGELLVVAMIESEEGARHAREIVETPGVGVVWAVHVSDEDSIRILKLCKERGVIAATEANSEDYQAKVEAGYRMIILGWDFELLKKELRETLQIMRTTPK